MTTATSHERVDPASRSRSAAQRELRQRLQALDALGDNSAELRQFGQTVAKEVIEVRERLADLTQVIEQYQKQLEELTTPPFLPGLVTRVTHNGSCHVEVQCRGGSRICVGLHEDITPESMQVGRRVLLNHQRNCVLHVDDQPMEMREVGVFERLLSPDTMLVKIQEQSIPLQLADSLRSETFTIGDQIGFDREAGIAQAKLLPPTQDHWFSEDFPDDSFDSLAGLDEPIHKLKQAVNRQLNFPALTAEYDVPTRTRILFDGPPGNGKTKIARCLAGWLSQRFPGQRCRFMACSGSEDYSPWFGQSEANVRSRFRAIRQAAESGPCVLFLDEVDSLARRRHTDFGSGAPDRTLNQILAELDGFQSLSNVIVLAATNRADMLDPAFVRAGRFSDVIRIPAPSRQTARGILEIYLGRGRPLAAGCSADDLIEPMLSALYSSRGAYGVVAQVRLSDNRRIDVQGKSLLSGALLEEVVRHAAEAALDRETENGARGIAEADLQQALRQQLRGVCSMLSPGNVKAYVSTLPQDSQPVSVEIVNPALKS